MTAVEDLRCPTNVRAAPENADRSQTVKPHERSLRFGDQFEIGEFIRDRDRSRAENKSLCGDGDNVGLPGLNI